MGGKVIAKPENNRTLVRAVQRWYWEGTNEDFYPERKVVQYVLCKLRQEYDIVKKDQA